MFLKNFYILGLSILLILASCSSGDNSYDKNLEIPDSILAGEDKPLEVSDEAMENIVQNLASPVEMAALIKSLDIPYQKEHLASTNSTGKYASSSTKAFNLGVYGADLGYINIYNKQSNVIEYITAIKQLADGINVGQFFDFSTLKRLASNSQNIDSMMYISVQSFNKIDTYLREQKRGNLSALMISGVWVEGLYLATQVVKNQPQEKLIQAIGEQKTILNQLMLLLDIYKNDDFLSTVIKNLKEIKSEFDKIKITIEVGEPESVIKDGKLTIIQHEKSIVHLDDEQLQTIIKKTERIRNELINVK